jgi:small-conductance mechanosensitive channel
MTQLIRPIGFPTFRPGQDVRFGAGKTRQDQEAALKKTAGEIKLRNQLLADTPDELAEAIGTLKGTPQKKIAEAILVEKLDQLQFQTLESILGQYEQTATSLQALQESLEEARRVSSQIQQAALDTPEVFEAKELKARLIEARNKRQQAALQEQEVRALTGLRERLAREADYLQQRENEDLSMTWRALIDSYGDERRIPKPVFQAFHRARERHVQSLQINQPNQYSAETLSRLVGRH